MDVKGDDEVLLEEPLGSVSFRWRRKRGKALTFFGLTLLAIVLLLLGIGFMSGILVGKAVYGAGGADSSPANSSPDWGAGVTVGGKTVSVLEWLDAELNPDNIRENLRRELPGLVLQEIPIAVITDVLHW